jgi:invasion protein IalB
MNKHRLEQWLPPLTVAMATLSVLLMSTLTGAQQAVPPGDATEKAGEPEMASRGQRKLVRQITYGDWQKFCFKAPGTNMVCRTTISGTFDSGQSAVRADLIEREGDSKARLQVFLPIGLYLQTPVKLTVDHGRPYQVPYVWCMTNTCIAGNPADPQLIRDMENGEKLTLEVVDSSVQSVSTELPLNQFAAVRKGVPAKTFLQDIDE